ncbi:hypothetical protein A4G23_04870 [Streptomyces rubrolavendulae]|uniref:Uncharacterized protein n=1 Tax=Streptomyces rubrolavendulae TaxID=285473 RepID=A0A1D8G971_9ACTN|nr:hypothetical protein A4G23_04870 [Streptomyces rubrolavendulae]
MRGGGCAEAGLVGIGCDAGVLRKGAVARNTRTARRIGGRDPAGPGRGTSRHSASRPPDGGARQEAARPCGATPDSVAGKGAMTDPGGSSACRAAPVCASRVPSGSRERADPPMPVGGYGDARRVLAGTFRSMTSGRLSESRPDTRGASGVRGAAGRGRTLAARPAGLPRRAARPHPGHGVPVAAGAQPRPPEAAPRGRGAASVRRDMGSGLRFSRYGRPCAVRQHVLTPAGLRRRAAAAAASPRAATGARRRVHGRVRVPAGGGMGNGAGPRRDRWGKGPHPR